VVGKGEVFRVVCEQSGKGGNMGSVCGSGERKRNQSEIWNKKISWGVGHLICAAAVTVKTKEKKRGVDGRTTTYYKDGGWESIGSRQAVSHF